MDGGTIRAFLAGLALAAAGVAAAREAPELARDVRLDVRTTPDSLAVGDRWHVELGVEAPAGFTVRLPPAPAPSQAGEVVEFIPARSEALPGGARARHTARYTFALFEVGPIALAPLSVFVQRDSLQATLATDSLRTFVTSVLDDSLAAADIRDLKPQARLAWPRWPWFVVAAVVVAVVLAIVLWRRRRARRAPVVPLVPQRPADEVALEALRRLETRRLPLDGRFEEHWVALSEVVRRYLEDGFGLAALEETSEEILFDLERHGFDRDSVREFRALCELGDLIKFARREPTVEECVQATARARDFVAATARRLRAAPPATVTGGEVA